MRSDQLIKVSCVAIIIGILSFTAFSHPLGNFSVNQYSRLEVDSSEIRIRQVLDLAEIPTFQEQSLIDTDKDGKMSEDELKAYLNKITPAILENLILTVNDERLKLEVKSSESRTEVGAGDLPTLKFFWTLSAKLPKLMKYNHVYFENKNFEDRIGWNEIVINHVGGTKVFDSTGFGSGITDELKAYPQESLDAPLKERNVQFKFTTAELPPDSKLLKNRDGHLTKSIERDKLAEIISVPEITPMIVLLGLVIAFGLGATHALSPGHGKTIVGAYLVGSRGTIKHALILGLTVTLTHTSSVFLLGLVTLFASNFILPEKLLPFLQFVSGLLVCFIGFSLLKNRLLQLINPQHFHYHSHHHGHAHPHEHVHISTAIHQHHLHDHHHEDHEHTHHGHSHLPPDEISLKSLISLGISGGLMPCPSALVLMLSAISLNRTAYGLLLILFFSIGLAFTLTLVGVSFLYLGRAFESVSENRLFKTIPVLSALIITFLGAFICYKSFN
jgi:ABC-type nickel/cobalt efflux system permease component RcnA